MADASSSATRIAAARLAVKTCSTKQMQRWRINRFDQSIQQYILSAIGESMYTADCMDIGLKTTVEPVQHWPENYELLVMSGWLK